jgi:HrpA-like RNA helicase
MASLLLRKARIPLLIQRRTFVRSFFVRALAPELGLKLSGNDTTADQKIVVKKEKLVELKKSDIALIEQVGVADAVLDRSRTNLTRMLMDFRDDEAQNQQAFPATLTKSDREFLHALSKQLGFRSKSKGLGENRKLVITKKRNARVPAMKLKGVVPVLKIGAIGKDALRDHMEKHPLSCAEVIDSHQTGVSLTTGLDNDATLERLTQLGLSAPEKVNRVTKYRFHADLERRLRVHETAQRSKEGHRSFEQMLKKRSQLPAYNHEKRIVEIVDANPITIIWGDTGCGT